MRLAVLAVCIMVAAAFGLWRGWTSVTVDPPGPPPVCQLIRPELFDVLVPGHGPLRSEGEEQSMPGTRSNTCLAENTPRMDGARASLWVALVRCGRHDGDGPRCIERDGAMPTALNRVKHRVALGDGAGYVVSGNPVTGQVVNFSACLGTYLVYVRYEAVGATQPATVESATVVAEEVLSWL